MYNAWPSFMMHTRKSNPHWGLDSVGVRRTLYCPTHNPTTDQHNEYKHQKTSYSSPLLSSPLRFSPPANVAHDSVQGKFGSGFTRVSVHTFGHSNAQTLLCRLFNRKHKKRSKRD
mmetsp:Transcript_41826/g.69657  ORF Transcript_41826/g.69657 Transcript_41826/m.69657 type:complete len:115 (+) Transcript_41826:686-1030(+)